MGPQLQVKCPAKTITHTAYMKILHTIGIIIIWGSVITCVTGIVLGLRHMVVYHELDDWWTIVPASFFVLFIGVAIVYLARPDIEDRNQE